AFGYPFLGGRRALSEEVDSLEEVQGAFELRVVCAGHAQTISFIEAVNSTGGALEVNVALFLLGERDRDVRSDPFFVNYFMAGGVVFGGGQAQGRAIVEGQNA